MSSMNYNGSRTSNVNAINLTKIFRILWSERKLFAKILPVVVICAYLLTLTVPRYYSCTMELAPEASGSNNSLNSLASSFGLGGVGKLSNNDDAISPDLYPDLLGSEDFCVTLFSVQVCSADGEVNTNYYDYVKNYREKSWLSMYVIEPIAALFEEDYTSTFKGAEKVDLRHMDKTQQNIAQYISKNISCSIDKKTGAITISFKEYDPEICATMSDSILGGIQNFIIDYRTKKARNDYAYYSKLRDEAKKEYEDARNIYASASDAYYDVISQSIKSSIDGKQKEMDIRYSNYATLASQAQYALSKIQENTPAFTIIKSPIVPIKPAGPKRVLIALGVAFLTFLGMSASIISKKLM